MSKEVDESLERASETLGKAQQTFEKATESLKKPGSFSEFLGKKI